MRQLRYIASLAIMLLAALPMQAQTENQAFYIYQNDGHFDGFFYDEIEKMSFSFLDTLGVEHDEIVSQEIITADSTYRIMLSAIDSIGFQQPEMVFNPQAHIRMADPELDSEADREFWNYIYEFPDNYICSFSSDMPTAIRPKVGDVLVNFDPYNSFSYKVESVDASSGNIYVYLKDIDDISDIFKQFVTVEEYVEDKQGNMLRRRVAGRPDLTIGQFPQKSATRSSSGTWEGNLFNFSINNVMIPLYHDDKLDITLNPVVEGSLDVKVVWNLSFWSDKYIGITTTLNMGVGCGFTVDGQITDFFPTGASNMVGIPIPAAFPLIVVEPSPDLFLRGDAHVKFSASSPIIRSRLTDIWEIKNWKPVHDMNFSFLKNEEGGSDDNNGSATLQLNGYIQCGLLFPLRSKTLDVINKIFKADLGGRWFIGPKISGEITLDLTNSFYEWSNFEKTFNESTHLYSILNGTKLSYGLCDADYEITATVKTLLSGEQKVKIAEGSIPIIPHLETVLAPSFEDGVEYTKEREVDGYGDELFKSRIFAFRPNGITIKTIPIGVAFFRLDDDGNEVDAVPETYSDYKLYKVGGLVPDLPKSSWAEGYIPYRPGKVNLDFNGKFRARPMVLWGGAVAVAPQYYDFEHGAIIEPSTDVLYIKHDGTLASPSVSITGTCDTLGVYGRELDRQYGDFGDLDPKYLSITGSKGKFKITTIPEKFQHQYNPCDTLLLTGEDGVLYGGIATIEEEIFRSDIHHLKLFSLPNSNDPVSARVFVDGDTFSNRYVPNIGFGNVSPAVSRLPDDAGWHVSLEKKIDSEGTKAMIAAEFDVVWDRTDDTNSKAWTTNRGVRKAFFIRNVSFRFEDEKYNEIWGNNVLVYSAKASGDAHEDIHFYSDFIKDGVISFRIQTRAACRDNRTDETETGYVGIDISLMFPEALNESDE